MIAASNELAYLGAIEANAKDSARVAPGEIGDERSRWSVPDLSIKAMSSIDAAVVDDDSTDLHGEVIASADDKLCV